MQRTLKRELKDLKPHAGKGWVELRVVVTQVLCWLKPGRHSPAPWQGGAPASVGQDGISPRRQAWLRVQEASQEGVATCLGKRYPFGETNALNVQRLLLAWAFGSSCGECLPWCWESVYRSPGVLGWHELHLLPGSINACRVNGAQPPADRKSVV